MVTTNLHPDHIQLVRPKAASTAALLLLCFLSHAQPYDLVIKNGHLIDPKHGINRPMDVAIRDGRIAALHPSIPAEHARQTIAASDLYIAPGLIDMHVHVFHGTTPDAYLCNSFESLPPDGFTFRSGTTTVVDAGCAGWRNFETFKKQTIDRADTRVLAFLNIVGAGMAGGAVEQNVDDMDPIKTASMAKKYEDIIVGIKLAHFEGPDWTPLYRTTQAGEKAGMPVMIDFGISSPPLSLDTLLNHKLRAGDIFTHAYAHIDGRIPIVDTTGAVRPPVWNARRRGIVFDVGHGGASFLFDQAVPALREGFTPHAISTDLHTGSMNAGMKDLMNVMSKFLNLGMDLQKVIAATTVSPAQSIGRSDLGHLGVGAVADVVIFDIEEGVFGFVDTEGHRIDGDRKLRCEMTIREGTVVWDLNGLASDPWQSR